MSKKNMLQKELENASSKLQQKIRNIVKKKKRFNNNKAFLSALLKIYSFHYFVLLSTFNAFLLMTINITALHINHTESNNQ